MRPPINLDTIQNIKAAFGRAKARIGGFSGGIGFAASLLLLSFILLAVLAPIAVKMPRIVQIILGFIPILALLGGVFVAVSLLIKISKNEKATVNSAQFSGTIAKTAIDIALGEAEDAGLKAVGAREFGDCFSGRAYDLPIVAVICENSTYAVIRLKAQDYPLIMLAPFNEPWPQKLPSSKSLTPLTPPSGIAAQAWGRDELSSRQVAQTMLEAYGPALKMSAIGGEVPFLYQFEKTLVLAWRNCDIGSAALIAHEIAKIIGNSNAVPK
ncbi:MAG: hypothetical protein FD163_1283 [Hyphomonadaceae bacterium]|nr:MAG: hypothetical protein FD163_1283 [Hyphomonadaceae bacterium]